MKGLKTGGRQIGSRNRTTAEVQKALLKLLDDHIDGLSDDIKAMPPEKRANILVQLAKHVTPAALNFDRLTEDQLQQVVDYLKIQNDEKNEIKKRVS